MKLFKHPTRLFSSYTDKKYLIFEDVYYDDIFENLIKNVIKKIDKTKIIINELSFEELMNLLPDYWSGKKYLKKKINLTFICFDFSSEDKINDLFDRMKFAAFECVYLMTAFDNSSGFFSTGFQNYSKNNVFIFLDSSVSSSIFYNTLSHELVHLFQDISGRSKVKINNEKIFELNEKDKEDIEKFLKIDEDEILELFGSREILAYTKDLFSILKTEIGNDKQQMKLFLDYMFYKLSIISNSFKDFFNKIKVEDDHVFNKNFNNVINNDDYPVVLLLISSYLKLGLNTIKNHLYGYQSKM